MIWTINELLLLVLAFAVLMVVLEFGFRMGVRASATSDEGPCEPALQSFRIGCGDAMESRSVRLEGINPVENQHV